MKFVNDIKTKPCPDHKTPDGSKMEAFIDDKMKLAKMVIFVFDKVENIVGKEEFSLFPTLFPKDFSIVGVMKSRDCVVKS